MSELAQQLKRIADLLEQMLSRKGDPLETVDVTEAAKLLHCSVRAVYELSRKGRLPKPIPGRRRLIWRRVDLLGGA